MARLIPVLQSGLAVDQGPNMTINDYGREVSLTGVLLRCDLPNSWYFEGVRSSRSTASTAEIWHYDSPFFKLLRSANEPAHQNGIGRRSTTGLIIRFRG